MNKIPMVDSFFFIALLMESKGMEISVTTGTQNLLKYL